MISSRYNGYIVPADRCPPVAGIRCFGVNRFYDVIFPVKRLVTDELYLHRSVTELFHSKNGHILVLVTVKDRA